MMMVALDTLQVLPMAAIRGWSRVRIGPTKEKSIYQAIEWFGFTSPMDESERQIKTFFDKVPVPRSTKREEEEEKDKSRPGKYIADIPGFKELKAGFGLDHLKSMAKRIAHDQCAHMKTLPEFASGNSSTLGVPLYKTIKDWLDHWEEGLQAWQWAFSPTFHSVVLRDLVVLSPRAVVWFMLWHGYSFSAPAGTLTSKFLLNAHDRLFFIKDGDDLVQGWGQLFTVATPAVQYEIVAALAGRAMDLVAMGQPKATRLSIAIGIGRRDLQFAAGQPSLMQFCQAEDRDNLLDKALSSRGMKLGRETMDGHSLIIHMKRSSQIRGPRLPPSLAPITKCHLTSIVEEFTAQVDERDSVAGFARYGLPLIQERPRTCVILSVRGQEEGPRITMDFLYTPIATTPFFVKVGDATLLFGVAKKYGSSTWPPHWWSHVLLLGAHRLDSRAIDILRGYVAQQRVLNGDRPDQGTFTLVGCPAFEYAQGYQEWRATSGVRITDLADLTHPPSDDTRSAIQSLWSSRKMSERVRVVEMPEEIAGIARPLVKQREGGMAISSGARLFSSMMQRSGDCGPTDGAGYCPRLRRIYQWQCQAHLRRRQEHAVDLLHQHPWLELPPSLLNPSRAGLRLLALGGWQLEVNEGALFWMTRDQFYFLLDFMARDERVKLLIRLKPMDASSIKDEELRNSPLKLILYMLGRHACKPTLNWTKDD
jgi:hypothetical protein